jgi:AcrR family transcriptional regulator
MDARDKSGKSVRPARRKPESLSKIKVAARKLFAERGYHATRPQDIAREAGLGHGTFYLHYPDKRACFLSFVEDARAELHEHIRGRSAAAAAPAVRSKRRSRPRWARSTNIPTTIRASSARR